MVKQQEYPSLEELQKRVDEAHRRLSVLQDTRLTEQVEEVLRRLSDPHRFVAVFGAFSAGKSSLINALLGRTALSVSPHPTTAVITEVEVAKGANSPSQDNTVQVWTKSPDEMWEDVSRALSYLHIRADTLEEGIRKGAALKASDFPSGSRRHISFLRAAAEGYDEMVHKLGQELEYPLDNLETLTANESIACYLHRVRIRSSASTIADGMVLVDTPGVDSIHRRHTDVAFDYMRHAEAVVFVLYYTHAFARADEAFLSQIAEVQKIVGVNKLFVVINAVDLATSEDERIAVQRRVTEELRRLGVNQQRVYEVSSQIAIAAKRLESGDDSPAIKGLLRQRLGLPESGPLPLPNQILEETGIVELGGALEHYLHSQAEQLAYSSVVSTYETVHHALSVRVGALRQFAQDNEEMRREKEAARQALAEELQRAVSLANGAGYEQEDSLVTEWNELMFHVGERIRLSLPATFRAAFHPSQFRSRANPRRVLQQAASEFAEEVNRKVEAEIRTLEMRMDGQVSEAIGRICSTLQSRTDALQTGYLEVACPKEREGQDLPVRANLSADILQPFFRFFTNPRQFFEEGGQRQMQDAALPTVMEGVTTVISSMTDTLVEVRLKQFRQDIEHMYTETAHKLRELTDESLGGPQTLIQYEETLHWLESELQALGEA